MGVHTLLFNELEHTCYLQKVSTLENIECAEVVCFKAKTLRYRKGLNV